MNKFLECKQFLSALMNMTSQSAHYFQIQNYDKAIRVLKSITEYLSTLIEQLIELSAELKEKNIMVEQELVLEYLKDIIEAQRRRDYILLADLLQLQLLPWLQGLMYQFLNQSSMEDELVNLSKNLHGVQENQLNCKQKLMTINPNQILHGKYELEYTSSGELTAKYQYSDNYIYMHSNMSPSDSAACLANSWAQNGKQRYIVYGVGLGYHIKKLLECQPYIEVIVYDCDLAAIGLALSIHDFRNEFEQHRLTIICDPDFLKLADKLSCIEERNESFVIYYPSMQIISNNKMRDSLETYFLQYSSIQNQLMLLNGNFYKNIGTQYHLLSELQEKFRDKNLYIVAAGPSLDKNYELLNRINKENSIILATGTVLRKLVTNNIRPDYVIITDANDRVYAQINGFERTGIPLIFLSTAYFGIAQKYQGEKYILFQRDFAPSEEYAKENNEITVETGGSVSTTALDLGIRLNCKQIIFLGLDLSFPSGYLHALTTSSRFVRDDSHLFEIKDIHGNTVKTSKSMLLYKKWIEERIALAKKQGYQGEIIDATEGGAKIEQMQVQTLAETIEIRGDEH